jgi:hypothetical protein
MQTRVLQSPLIQWFLYLQVLDFLTTLVGFKFGAHEASPFIAKLMQASTPALGLAVSKVVGLGIGALCVVTQRIRLVGWVNYWYAGLVVWNLGIILAAGSRLAH